MPEAGQTLSHYRLVEKIGEGGMGVVWRAEDTKLDRKVAIKLLTPALCNDETARKRLLREAKSAAAQSPRRPFSRPKRGSSRSTTSPNAARWRSVVAVPVAATSATQARMS